MDAAPQLDREVRAGPSGIGGWLILPVLWFISMPFVMAYRWWSALQFVSWNRMIICFAVIDGLIMLFSGFVAAAFFRRKKSLILLLQLWFGARLIAAFLADWLLASYLDRVFDVSATVQLALAAAIWIPYFRVSERVKNTFTR